DMIVLLWMYGGLHDKAHGSLTSLARSSLCGALPWLLLGPVLALAAQLPTGCAPRDPRWGTSPTEGLEAQGAYGTPSEVTRYDHCNRRSLGWYRAPTTTSPVCNAIGVKRRVASAPSMTSRARSWTAASALSCIGFSRPFCCVCRVPLAALPES